MKIPFTFFSHCDVGATWPGPASTIWSRPNLCLTQLSTTVLSCRAHPRSGSVQTSPTSTPMSSRRGRQLPQLPPTGKERSKSPGCFLFALQGYCRWKDVKTCVLVRQCVSVQYLIMIFGGPTDWCWGGALVFTAAADCQQDLYLLMESLSISYRSHLICEDLSLLF